MGVHNTYGGVQLKLPNDNLMAKDFKIGDRVKIEDGIYVGYEGFVVIVKHKLVAVFQNIITKHGHLFLNAKDWNKT